MGSVGTPILKGPRPSTRQRRARIAYTLICEEPGNRRLGTALHLQAFTALGRGPQLVAPVPPALG